MNSAIEEYEKQKLVLTDQSGKEFQPSLFISLKGKAQYICGEETSL